MNIAESFCLEKELYTVFCKTGVCAGLLLVNADNFLPLSHMLIIIPVEPIIRIARGVTFFVNEVHLETS